MTATFDPAKHPRHPAGSERGGQFAPLYHVAPVSQRENISREGLKDKLTGKGVFLWGTPEDAEIYQKLVGGDVWEVDPEGLEVATDPWWEEDPGRRARWGGPGDSAVTRSVPPGNVNLLRGAVRAAAWDPAKHPREPKGSERGGEFLAKSVGAWVGVIQGNREIAQAADDIYRGRDYPADSQAHSQAQAIMEAARAGVDTSEADLSRGSVWVGRSLPKEGEIIDAPIWSFSSRPGVPLNFAESARSNAGKGKLIVYRLEGPDGQPPYGVSTSRADTLFGDEGEFIVSGPLEVGYVTKTDARDLGGYKSEPVIEVYVKQSPRGTQASAWEESAHPRHPAGTDKGGEFSPAREREFINQVREAEHAERKGFPPGEFTPDEKVQFWPQKIGYRDGPAWKAWLDPKTGKELAFWFVTPVGFPHHMDMARELGIDPPKLDEVLVGPLRVSGYGNEPDMGWMSSYFRDDLGVNRDEMQRLGRTGNQLHDMIMGSVNDMVNRHRKDIEDADIVAHGPLAMAASALFEQVADAEAELQRQYEKVLRRAAKRAATQYRAAMKVVTAAGQPQPEEILAAQALLESFLRVTGVARRNLLNEILQALGVLHADAETPNDAIAAYIELLQEQAGVQAARLVAGTQDAVADVLLDAMDQGWPVPQTATALQEKLEGVAPWQATMLARTDMVALANGASLKRAVMLDSPELQFKTWLATPDERTRIDHRHAHGQTVPIVEPFTVGGEQLLYPGDPSASDGNVINCRCTVIYSDTPFGPPGIQQIAMLPDLAVSAAAWEEAAHPRHPKGGARGGEFRGKALLDEIARQRAERAARLGRTEPEYDPSLKGMWSPDADEYIFDPDDPYFANPVWKAIKLPDGSWKFWITDKRGFPHHDAVVRRLGLPYMQGALYSGDKLNVARDDRGEPLNPELAAVLQRNAGKYRAAQERTTGMLAASAFDPSKHPRHPAGSPRGGEFAPGDTVSGRTMVGDREVSGKVVGISRFGPIVETKGGEQLTVKQNTAEHIGDSGLAHGNLEATPPAWWGEPSENAFAHGRTKGEMLLDWLERNEVAQDDEGRYIFYHGTPAANEFESLAANSLLETDPEKAAFFAGRDRGLKRDQVKVYEVHVWPWEIGSASVWAGLRDDYDLGRATLRAAAFDESKHPRHPAGTEQGGEFAPKLAPYYGVRLVPGEGYQAYRMHRGYGKGSSEGSFRFGAIHQDEAAARAEANAAFDAEQMVDWGPAEREFEKWAGEMERFYGPPFKPDYFDKQKLDLWRRYQEGVLTSAAALAQRLAATGEEGVRLVPELNPSPGGDIDQLLDTAGTFAADFDVSIPGEGIRPGFTVWTHADGTFEIEDVLDITDTDFFPDGPDSPLVTKYVALVDAARGGSSQEGYVTLYRGMSDSEADAWHGGEDIPPGKFFTSIPTVQYAMDRSGQPPNLFTFRVPRAMVTEVGPNEFQLKKKGKLDRGEIVQASALLADAVPYTGGGGMVCLYPKPEEAEAIAREKGQPAKDLHVTLLFFPDGVPGDVEQAVLDADVQFEGLKGEISGIARFAEGENGVPIVGIVSAPGLGSLRAELAEALPGYSDRYDFVPHMTLGYDFVKDEQGAVGLPVTFSAVKVKNKGDEPRDVLTAAAWEESEHPRHPAGSEKGGEFSSRIYGIGSGSALESAIRDWDGSEKRKQQIIQRAHDLSYEDHLPSEWGIPVPERKPLPEPPPLTPLQRYTQNSFFVNAGLRGVEKKRPEDAPIVEALDKLIAEEGEDSTPGMVVYRGDSGIEGETHWTDPGFLSTTTNPDIALDFSDNVMEMHVEPGTRYYRVPAGTYDMDQEEIIFPRGTEVQRQPDGTWKISQAGLRAAGWDEAAHPRWPAGSERGGEFAPKDATTVSEARLGQQAHGGFRVSKAPNLRVWMQDYPFRESKPDWMKDLLEEWPNITSLYAVQLRDWLNRSDVQEALAKHGMGKERQEAKWVLRDLGQPITAPVQELPQLPTEHGPVRSLLDNLDIGGGRAGHAMLEAARTVDRTIRWPKVPGEPRVEMKGVAGGRSRQAAFWRTRGHAPYAITVAANGANPISSTVHELGHYLDSTLGQDPWSMTVKPDPAAYAKLQQEYDQANVNYNRALGRSDRIDPETGASATQLSAQIKGIRVRMGEARAPLTWNDYSSMQGGGTLQPVVEAIKQTAMYHHLNEYAAGRSKNALGYSEFSYGGRSFAPGRTHVRYLLRHPELIARSFEQYVASKNPGSKLANTSRHAFSDGFFPPEYPGYLHRQDLEHVNAAWDQVLTQRGLLKKPAKGAQLRQLAAAAWQPERHPRHPAGSERGGQFAPLYHGTNVPLQPGDQVSSATQRGYLRPGELPKHYDPSLVYMSTADHLAERYAVAKAGREGGEPHVYEVAPVGEIQLDPEAESGFGTDQRIAPAAKVIREVPLPGGSHWEDGMLKRGPAEKVRA